MRVNSDKDRKPQYWVTVKGKTIYESDSASRAIQHAVNKMCTISWALENDGRWER